MSDAFTHQIFRTVLARRLKFFKFTSASESSLDVIVDATINRITEIAREASNRASGCGRTEANAYDLIISLNEYNIPFSELIRMTQDLNRFQIPPYDFLISPYPVVSNSSFYRSQTIPINKKAQQSAPQSSSNYQQNQQNQSNAYQQQAHSSVDAIANDIFVPFRSNTTASFFSPNVVVNNNINADSNPNPAGNPNVITAPNLSNIMSNSGTDPSQNDNSKTLPYIPQFFSKLPPQYTYDETPMSDLLSPGEASILDKSREDDQRESKESLAQLNKSSLKDQLFDDTDFELNLIKPPEMDRPIGKYAEEKKSGIYQMEGENPGIDPEFMAKLDLRDINNSLQSPSKDVKSMINILTSTHKKEGKKDDDGKNDD